MSNVETLIAIAVLGIFIAGLFSGVKGI